MIGRNGGSEKRTEKGKGGGRNKTRERGNQNMAGRGEGRIRGEEGLDGGGGFSEGKVQYLKEAED